MMLFLSVTANQNWQHLPVSNDFYVGYMLGTAGAF
jgi:hypothetical protein